MPTVLSAKINKLVRDVPTVLGTDHHSDKIATTTNSLLSTKISIPIKMLNLNCQLLYVTHTHICSVYKEFPR